MTACALQLAAECGFELAGVSELHLPPEEINSYVAWLERREYGSMDYLPRGLELRLDPRKLLEGALAVLSVGLLYRPREQHPQAPDQALYSRYAWGRDYHKVMKGKLKRLSAGLLAAFPEYRGRAFADSAPVFEKLYASQAGLGSKGKNSLLISRTLGSEFFIGEIITSLPLAPTPRDDWDPCQSCHACVDACPTGALSGDRTVNAARCLAYLTIESPDPIPQELCPALGCRIFGCDACQGICPWNRRRIFTSEPDFACRLTPQLASLEYLLTMDEEQFLMVFQGSVIRRPGWAGFMRNVLAAAGNSGQPHLLPLIRRFADHANPMLRTQARWAAEHLEDSLAKEADQGSR